MTLESELELEWREVRFHQIPDEYVGHENWFQQRVAARVFRARGGGRWSGDVEIIGGETIRKAAQQHNEAQSALMEAVDDRETVKGLPGENEYVKLQAEREGISVEEYLKQAMASAQRRVEETLQAVLDTNNRLPERLRANHD